MNALLELSTDQLRQWFIEHSLPAYRAGQVRKWIFQKRAAAFDAMTDLSAALREQLSTEFHIWTTRVAEHHRAEDGSEKLLLELHDAHRIECVLLRDDKQHCTVCISTQVGLRNGLCVLRHRHRRRGPQSFDRVKYSKKSCNCSDCSVRRNGSATSW